MSTKEQREEISGRLSTASTWLEDEGFGATTVVRGLLGYDRWDGNSLLPGSKKVRKLGYNIKKVAGLPPGLFCCPFNPLLTPTAHPSDVEGEAGRAEEAVPRVVFSGGRT